MKAGINKILLEKIDQKTKTTISIPDHLKEVKYKVIDVGPTRTNFEHPIKLVSAGDFVHIMPNAGYAVKEDGKEYLACSVDEILAIS